MGRAVRACGDVVGASLITRQATASGGWRPIVVDNRKRWNRANELSIHKMIVDPDSIQILSISNKHCEGNGDFSCW